MMKLGKDTGSLVNWLSQQNGYHKPEVGEDVTELMWTDRRAYRCIAVDADGKGATLRRYNPKFVGESFADQRYEYVDALGNPLLCEGQDICIRWRYQKWRVQTAYGWSPIDLAFGMREEYEDPSF